MSLAIQPAAAAIDCSQIFGVRANGRVRQKVRADVLFPGDPDKLELQIAIELRLTGGGWRAAAGPGPWTHWVMVCVDNLTRTQSTADIDELDHGCSGLTPGHGKATRRAGAGPL